MSEYSNSTDTNDARTLTAEELLSIYGISAPAGNTQVNSVKAPSLYGDKLIIKGDAFIYGCIRTPLTLCSGIYFGDGTEDAPSITFANDPTTGLYRAGTGLIGFSSQGVTDVIIGGGAMQVDVPITTSGGSNLVLNPSGSSIDFSGKTLINIGGISSNPNRYEVIAPTTVITTNATPTTILTIPTVTGSAYTISVDVAAADVSDSISSAAYTINTKGKNLAGVASVIAPYTIYTPALDAALASSGVSFSASGSDIIVVAVGVAATTIKWQAAATITRQLF